MDNLSTYIESLVFSAETPISRQEIRYALENCFETQLSEELVDNAIDELTAKYAQEHFAIEVKEIAGGLQFLTKPAFHHVIGAHLKLISKKRLSRVALETLAIIAYKQPVTKSELEQIRGVNSDYSVQKLLDKELVQIVGRSDGPGRPLLYATTDKFMDYLGLKDLNDLPKLKELNPPDNSIGDGQAVDDDEIAQPKSEVEEQNGNAVVTSSDKSDNDDGEQASD